MRNRKSILGFTLAELLMVVVILGVLSAVALPKFAPQKEKAVVAEAIGMLSAIRQAQEAYRLENGVYKALPARATSADWQEIGLEQPATTGVYWTYTVAGAVAGTPPAFSAIAKRTSKNDPRTCSGACLNKTVTLKHDGTYDHAAGKHPNTPT